MANPREGIGRYVADYLNLVNIWDKEFHENGDVALQAELEQAVWNFIKRWGAHHQHNSGQATRLAMTMKGAHMASTFTVDTTDGVATLQFADDHGDPTAGPNDSVTGAAVVPVVVSDNSAAVTVGPEVAGATPGEFTYTVSPAGIGVGNVSVSPLVNSDGSPVVDSTGVAFTLPDAVQITVVAGAASELSLTVTG